MGNFADNDMLFCDEELDIFCDSMDIDDDMNVVLNYEDIISVLDEYNNVHTTLQPQHLLFDGLDEEYSFDKFCEKELIDSSIDNIDDYCNCNDMEEDFNSILLYPTDDNYYCEDCLNDYLNYCDDMDGFQDEIELMMEDMKI